MVTSGKLMMKGWRDMEQELGVRNTCSIMDWVGILHNPTLKVTMYHNILHNVHPHQSKLTPNKES